MVISGLCIGPKLTMASELDRMLSSPKVKVKVPQPYAHDTLAGNSRELQQNLR